MDVTPSMQFDAPQAGLSSYTDDIEALTAASGEGGGAGGDGGDGGGGAEGGGGVVGGGVGGEGGDVGGVGGGTGGGVGGVDGGTMPTNFRSDSNCSTRLPPSAVTKSVACSSPLHVSLPSPSPVSVSASRWACDYLRSSLSSQ